MTNKKWAVLLVLISIPISYYGFSNFEKDVIEPFEAILISLACTGGVSCLIGGIYMFFTKEKGRGEDLLASQTKVGDSSVEKLTPERVAEIKKHNQKAVKEFADKVRKETKEEIINKKVKPMAKAKDANINKSVEEIRELEESRVQSEEIIKKETLNAKTITEKIAVLKHSLAKDKTVQELLAMIEK